MVDNKMIIKALNNKKIVAMMNPKELAIKIHRNLEDGILKVYDIPQYVRDIIEGIDTSEPTTEERLKMLEDKIKEHKTFIDGLEDKKQDKA